MSPGLVFSSSTTIRMNKIPESADDGESGGKTPAITASQTRQIFTRLLRHPAPGPEQIAEEVTRVLRRNEESRIYHWHKATGEFPPRRPRPNTS